MVNEKKTLGVIGGLGPSATAYFMSLVTDMTDAATDQEHIEMVVFSTPAIPDRTRYILDNSQPSPLPKMQEVAGKLEALGAAYLAIPCITAHYFYDGVAESTCVPVIHAPRETARYLKEEGLKKVGIMATAGTLKTGVLSRELEKLGMEAVIPSGERQADLMHVIYDNVKAGQSADMDRFRAVERELRQNGAEAIILGCTELSLVKRDNPIGSGFIDAMEVLAQQSVIRCGGKLKEAYTCLISK